MSMTIPSASSSPSILPAGSPGGREIDLQQASSQTRQYDISIQTKEGDVVTFSSAEIRALAISAGPESLSVEAAAADLKSFSVQGDLNEEELADIKHLLNDLRSVAAHFFAGRFDQAFAKGDRLGEMGDSLAQMEVSLSSSISFSHVLTDHPLPASFGEAVAKQLDDRQPKNEEPPPDYLALLSERWRQIRKLLTESEPPAPAVDQPPTKSPPEAARQLFARSKAELRRHPEIAPLLPELGRGAIRQAAALFPPAAQPAANRLQQEFMDLYRAWLL